MPYDTWSPWDPNPADTPEQAARLQARRQRAQASVRAMLPRLEAEIENPDRDMNSVGEVLRPYYDALRNLPMTIDDLPQIESLFSLILEKGGMRQGEIQTVLLRLVGATAAPESVPFLLDALHFSRRGDQFGPERRQLALWGLARIAIKKTHPEAYQALREGLDDRHRDVRFTTLDLILDAYLSAEKDVPKEVFEKVKKMARSDPDQSVRRAAKRYLKEPWAQERDV